MNCSGLTRDAAGRISRRDLLRYSAAALAIPCLPHVVMSARAAEDGESHGMSAFGDLKYPRDFRHFDYVDPAAPKGGLFSHVGANRQFNQNLLTFNSLNGYILRGDAAQGIERTFATLMARAYDEPDAMYGFAARAVRISPDRLTCRFHLRPQACFHEGSKLTAADVAFSLATLQEKGHPMIRQMLRDMEGVEALDESTVVVRFAAGRARDVPLFVAGMPIFSRAYYASRPFSESTLDIPLGSGPYKVGRLSAGRFIEYERVKDWWGADLPVMRGQNNFDLIRYEYFRDRDAAFQGFTARNYLFREEFTSRVWATRYDFPAMRDGRVKRDILPDETPSGGQGWFINTRRDKLKDRRVREALILAFDFDWTNKSIMHGLYERTHSVFQSSDLMAKGKPGAEELALLEPLRGQVSDEVFGECFVPAASDGSGQDRALLRRASQLLNDAGFRVKDGKRVTAAGEPFSIEFLIDDTASQPHHMLFIKNLESLGIEATLRVVDPVQYHARVDDFDFDITVQRFGFSTTPGDSLRTFFSSPAAAMKGSQNPSGMADPAIDAMIERVIAADSREELITACRALDRLIRAGRYWIPHWYKASHWVAYWDTFGRPTVKPKYGRGAPDTWWYAGETVARIEQRA